MNRHEATGSLALERLERGPLELETTLPADPEFWSAPELVFQDPPAVSLRASASADGGVHVHGRLTARLAVDCRRCLKDVPVRLEVPVDIWFEPDLEAGEESEGVFGFDPRKDAIDLIGPLREELLLAVPRYPLCRPDCRGLCPVCGVDRNLEECECVVAEADPRWERLRELLAES